MLYRISGSLTSGENFASRVEASSAIEAVAIGKKALNENDVEDSKVFEIRSRPVKGGKSVKFSKPKTKGEKKAPATPTKPTPAKK